MATADSHGIEEGAAFGLEPRSPRALCFCLNACTLVTHYVHLCEPPCLREHSLATVLTDGCSQPPLGRVGGVVGVDGGRDGTHFSNDDRRAQGPALGATLQAGADDEHWTLDCREEDIADFLRTLPRDAHDEIDLESDEIDRGIITHFGITRKGYEEHRKRITELILEDDEESGAEDGENVVTRVEGGATVEHKDGTVDLIRGGKVYMHFPTREAYAACQQALRHQIP